MKIIKFFAICKKSISDLHNDTYLLGKHSYLFSADTLKQLFLRIYIVESVGILFGWSAQGCNRSSCFRKKNQLLYLYLNCKIFHPIENE